MKCIDLSTKIDLPEGIVAYTREKSLVWAIPMDEKYYMAYKIQTYTPDACTTNSRESKPTIENELYNCCIEVVISEIKEGVCQYIVVKDADMYEIGATHFLVGHLCKDEHGNVWSIKGVSMKEGQYRLEPVNQCYYTTPNLLKRL